MIAVAAVAVALVAAAFILRCTVLAPATGRHTLAPHRGWEGRTSELHTLTLTTGRHARVPCICGDHNPWDNTITCNLPAHRGDERHERRLPNGDIQAWTDHCHYDGDDCGPHTHTPDAA